MVFYQVCTSGCCILLGLDQFPSLSGLNSTQHWGFYFVGSEELFFLKSPFFQQHFVPANPANIRPWSSRGRPTSPIWAVALSSSLASGMVLWLTPSFTWTLTLSAAPTLVAVTVTPYAFTSAHGSVGTVGVGRAAEHKYLYNYLANPFSRYLPRGTYTWLIEWRREDTLLGFSACYIQTTPTIHEKKLNATILNHVPDAVTI